MPPGFRKRDWPLYALLYLISRLPFPALYALSDFLRWLLYAVFGYRRKVVMQNLRLAFPGFAEPQLQQIASDFYQNLADIICETIKLTTMTRAELLERVRIDTAREMIELAKGGQPVLLLASHHCNWEWVLASGTSQYEFEVDGVYKPLHSPFFETYLRHLRSRFGAVPLPMKDVLRDVVKRQHVGRAIALVADQTPPKAEIQHWTEFMHQETGFYVGTEKIARTFHYPVFFVDTRRTGRGYYTLKVYRLDQLVPPSPGSAYPLTDFYARRLEQVIREQPEAYLWSHRRWKHKKPAPAPVASGQE